MANNSTVNLDISNLSVGFSIGGGVSKRTCTHNGTGNQTFTSQQTIVLTLPNRSSDTIVGFGDYSAKGVILVGTGSGTFAAVSVGGNGTYLTADSGQSSGVNWTAASGNYTWTNVTGTTQTIAVNTAYIANNASQVVFTLPTTASIGQTFKIVGNGAGGWKIAQNASQILHFGNQDTTTGTGGSITSTNRYDGIEFVCTVANNEFVATGDSQGNLTIA